MRKGKIKTCMYGCGQELQWDDDPAVNGYVEIDTNDTPHSRDRCQQLKQAQGIESSFNGGQPKAREQVKEAVNSDLMMAVLQKLEAIHKTLKKIAGEEQ